VERESISFSRKETEVPKLILATVASLVEPRPSRRYDDVHARTRSRDASRRLHASKLYEPYVNISALDLTRTRH